MQIVIYVNLFSELSFNEIIPSSAVLQEALLIIICWLVAKIYVRQDFHSRCDSRNAHGEGKLFYEKQTIKQNMCLDKAKAKGKGHAKDFSRNVVCWETCFYLNCRKLRPRYFNFWQSTENFWETLPFLRKAIVWSYLNIFHINFPPKTTAPEMCSTGGFVRIENWFCS